MAIKKFQVEFDGTVTISFDTEHYAHRDTSTPEGLESLATDIFYDEAQLRSRPFVESSSEFNNATFEELTD